MSNSQEDTKDTKEMDASAMQKQISELTQLMEMQMKLMSMHTQAVTQTSLQPATPTMMSPHNMKHVMAPEGRYDMNSSEFRMYTKDCHDFRTLTQFTDEQIVIQMRLNMDAQLKQSIDTNFGTTWNTFTMDKALESIKSIVKYTNNVAIFRKEFDKMDQKGGETIKEYVTRLKTLALDCEFVCPYDDKHDLTDYHIINRLRCGILDKQLQQELLQKSHDMPGLSDVVTYCASFESAKADRDKLNGAAGSIGTVNLDEEEQNSSIAALSTYRQSKHDMSKCHYCGLEKHDKSKCPALGKRCSKCNKMNHFTSVCTAKKKKPNQTIPGSAAVIISTIERVQKVVSEPIKALPRLGLKVSADNIKFVTLQVIADTGAQVCVAGIAQMKKLQIQPRNLQPPAHELKHVGGGQLNVLGSVTLQIQHNSIQVNTVVHFVDGIENMYLSIETCKSLGIISDNFPFSNLAQSGREISSTVKQSPSDSLDNGGAIPPRPETLPFIPVESNASLFEKWLLEKFGSSAFNTKADVLPVMSGEPHKIHLKEGYTPFAAHSPIPVPHHWKDQVKAQLDRDEQLGIIQKVPVGEASELCMRMVVVAKADGSPRRTIDFKPINKYCAREAHYTPTPFNAVNGIPKQVYKTVLDAHNGYHQVLLDKDSVKLTTFITEFGRYQYLRAPQGHIASGDGYVRRFDDILSDVERKQKVVDDLLVYDSDIESAFYHTFDVLTLCAKNGVTINPEKFKFARREVDFVGYHVGWDSFKPSDSTLAAVREFPMPDDPTLTDIRSWYGLVNQLAPFMATSSLMSPFRDLLKSTHAHGKKVYWDTQLKQIFEDTKEKLCALMEEGLSFYDTKRDTVLVTDWSKTGMGFVIRQKHCKCPDTEQKPLCCSSGWKPIYCGSRHLHENEQDFRPIEGEALAIEWALKKGRLFLLGNPLFDVIVDHKPLLKILGDKPIEDIENPILQSVKENISPFSFRMKHVKGEGNEADVLSRYPASSATLEDEDYSTEISAINIASVYKASEAIAITMDVVRAEAQIDDQYVKLVKAIKDHSFAKHKSDELPCLREFHSVKDRLSIVDQVVMYAFEENCSRILIPSSLRKKTIENLHSANQGSSSMLARARKAVYWPGIDKDINDHCAQCTQCIYNAPSKQKEPLVVQVIPEYPFQKVASDMFDLDGYLYLVYVDRLTGFPEVAFFPSSSSSTTVINVLREFFSRWGVPEEVSLDGAPNYTSSEITEWLKSWGVSCRISSAYYPQSNGRAEVAVKSVKRLLRGNTGPRGSLCTDKVAKALMQFRNTPMRNGDKSPAELALGRPIRDTLPLPKSRYCIHPDWALHLQERELAMAANQQATKQQYDQTAKGLKELVVGDRVACQNVRTRKWDRCGLITELKGHRQYSVRMDGSGRLTIRNRRHLHRMIQDFGQVMADTPGCTTAVNSDVGEAHPALHRVSEESGATLEVVPEENQVVDDPTELPVRRSGRNRRPPERFRHADV